MLALRLAPTTSALRWSVVLAALAFAPIGVNAQEADRFATLKIATWNLEWLIAPARFKPLKDHCVPKGVRAPVDQRRLPCDVAERRERSSRDFATLARYARQLDADVIALQEVDGVEAARLVFTGYQFCFSGSRHLQNTGFAVRNGLPMRCTPDVVALSLNESVRRGATVTLFPNEQREVRLMSIHLKSGCSSKPLNADEKACTTLARQVPALEDWIDTQAAARRLFGVLGDFNRTLLGESGPARAANGRPLALWPEIDDGQPEGAELMNPATGQRFRNCVPGQAHAAFIDHIVLGRSLAAAMVPGSFQRVTFSAADARHARLSDHCPVAVRLDMRQIPRDGT